MCKEKLKANSKILIMDCTYKSNKYQLLLLNIVGTTSLNTTFYVVFEFLLQKKKKKILYSFLPFFTLYTDDWI